MVMDKEIVRKIIHVLAAVAAAPFLLFFDLTTGILVALAGLGIIWTIWYLEERGRKLKGPARKGQEMLAKTMENAMRPEERFPWASFYFVAGLIAVASASQLLEVPLSVAFAAYAVLGVGDAGSALIGKAYGAMPIPWNPKKSWEGTGAGIGAAYPWAVLLATAFYAYFNQPFPSHLYWIIMVGTLVGMLAETLPGEDNLTIPVASWATMAALGALIGLF
ncbi:MAG: hypothetical protein R3185_04780 [Candidatus Thermoplasmatota archaeon]|nr:hypothetical protein [Candidatus Thermoplasmatota archaeon]